MATEKDIIRRTHANVKAYRWEESFTYPADRPTIGDSMMEMTRRQLADEMLNELGDGVALKMRFETKRTELTLNLIQTTVSLVCRIHHDAKL